MSIVYIENNDPHSTLTTWIYCSFAQSYAAQLQGHIVYINWPRFKSVASYDDPQMFNQVPNMYDWYFEQPFVHGVPSPDETRTWNTDPNGGILLGQPLETIRDFYHKNLKFNSATNNRGQALADKYNINFSKTIGITWRGTDIYLENQNGNVGRKRTPIENYFQFIDEILNENPDYRIACTAEEMSILDPLLKRYPMVFVIEEFEQVPLESQHNPERFSARSGFDRGLQPALMVWLFSKCAHYIKNRSSTGAVASWISDGKIYSLHHPETLGHDNKIGFAEIEGKLIPIR